MDRYRSGLACRLSALHQEHDQESCRREGQTQDSGDPGLIPGSIGLEQCTRRSRSGRMPPLPLKSGSSQNGLGRCTAPNVKLLQRQSRGYPDLGIADLGLCQPDEKCREFVGPVEYAADLVAEKDWSRGSQKHIQTTYQARVFDWTAGKVGEIELSLAEKDELEGLQRMQKENEMLIYTRAKLRGRLRPRFFLKESEGPKRRLLSELL